jgi:hypothetical protein
MFTKSPTWFLGIKVNDVNRILFDDGTKASTKRENIIQLFKIVRHQISKEYHIYSSRTVAVDNLVGIYTGIKFPEHGTVTEVLCRLMKFAAQTIYGWVDPDYQMNASSATFHGMGLHHARFPRYLNLANAKLDAYFLVIATKPIGVDNEIVVCCDRPCFYG